MIGGLAIGDPSSCHEPRTSHPFPDTEIQTRLNLLSAYGALGRPTTQCFAFARKTIDKFLAVRASNETPTARLFAWAQRDHQGNT
jgi:hypothetical protein